MIPKAINCDNRRAHVLSMSSQLQCLKGFAVF